MFRRRDKLLYFLFFLEGVGSLFPWNAFITVTSFFDERFIDSKAYKVCTPCPYLPPPALMASQGTYENYFSFSFQISNILFLLLAMRFQQRFSLFSRVTWPLVLQVLVFTAMTVLTKVSNRRCGAWACASLTRYCVTDHVLIRC